MYQTFLGILWLCAKIIISSQTNTTDFVGILTGDDNLTVFADGRLIGYNGGSWSAARWFTFPMETKVIAVSVYNIPGHVGGFLGVFSNGVATDSSWKCKEILITPDDGWEQTNFNDITWPRAFIRHDNSGPGGFVPVLGIPHNVHWISTANHNAVRFICRHHFTEEEKLSNSTLIAIRASSPSQTIKLYLDGVFTAKADLSLTVVKDQHELQAIHVEDSSVAADVFFLSSSSNGVRTDGTSWRCSNQYHEGWFLPNFTDHSWPRPYTSASNTYFIAPDAHWLAYLLAQSNKIFCRRSTSVEPDLHIVSSYDTPSSVASLVPQKTTFPTSSITSTTVVRRAPAMMATAPTRTIVSTVVAQSATNSSRTFSVKVSSISKTNGFSTLVIVVIAVSAGVTVVAIGLIVSCYIWRRRNSGRGNNKHKLQKKDETRDKWELKSNEVTLCEELGHGAFGKVCKGILKTPLCMKTGQSVNKTSKKIANSTITVAVKMLQDNATPDQMNDFLEEIILMKAVGSHKNIVSLIGCCTKSTPNFLIVEFASKGDLLSYLRERRKKVKDTNMDYVNVRKNASNTPGSLNKDGAGIYCRRDVNDNGQVNVAFSRTDSSIDVTVKSVQSLNDEEQVKGDDEDDCITPQDMMSFSWQIAQGMQYLSAKGIVHRDLAARNVLVCDNKLVKVADFGLARSTLGENVYHMTGQHNKLPVKWMSPEAINDGIFTTKSDVWSYGVLLWEIATLGGFPYPGIKNRELMRLLRRGYRMEKPDTCSEEFYQMMRRCWADNPDARPTFTGLCQELEDWIQREIPYLDMDQLNEDQPYYEASAAASLSSGSSCDGHAPRESLPSNTAADNLACDENEVTSESTNV